MKKYILCFVLGVIITCGIVYAADILMEAKSVSYTSEYTDKTNVADAIDELMEQVQDSLSCSEGFECYGKDYTITYNTNGGTLEKTTYNSVYNDTYWLEAPTKSGYAFGGWFLDESLTKYVSSTTKVKTASNHTLYAKWGSPVTVTFNANGGKVNPETKEVALEGRYGVLPRAYKEGYILEGWYSDSELTNKVNESTTVTNENNHILYAKWVLGNTPLYDVVLSKLDTSKKSQAMSYGAAPTENGVFEYDGPTSSDKGELPIYFYRGNITNNNVLFAGYCWKITRTTSTGGTKLIYAGVPTGTAPNYTCNNTGDNTQITTKAFTKPATDDPHHAFYIINQQLRGNQKDSTIKNYIENEWFNGSNFAGENNSNYVLLEDTPYCVHREYTTNNSLTTNQLTSDPFPSAYFIYFGAYIRVRNIKKPSLSCYYKSKEETDILTNKDGQLKKKMGLISADEVMLAGGGTFNNTNYYLYSGSNYWTLSPAWAYPGSSSQKPAVFFVKTDGYVYDQANVDVEYGVRPVISLSINAKVSGGNGQSSSPYTIES